MFHFPDYWLSEPFSPVPTCLDNQCLTVRVFPVAYIQYKTFLFEEGKFELLLLISKNKIIIITIVIIIIIITAYWISAISRKVVMESHGTNRAYRTQCLKMRRQRYIGMCPLSLRSQRKMELLSNDSHKNDSAKRQCTMECWLFSLFNLAISLVKTRKMIKS